MSKMLLLVLAFILTSCATTMPGRETKTGSKNISATIEKNPNFSNEQIQMFQFSIKNQTNHWIDFDGATMVGNEEVGVLVGDRISSWVEACTLEKNVADYNTSLVLGSIAVAGAVVAGGSQHPQTSSAGAIFALGSITALGVRDFQNSKNKVEFQKAFPQKHIFKPFSLPPGKVIQRWILVENPKGAAFELSIQSQSGEAINLVIPSTDVIPAMFDI